MFAAQRAGTPPTLPGLGARLTLLQRARFQTQASGKPLIFLPRPRVTLGTSLMAEALPLASEPHLPGSGGRLRVLGPTLTPAAGASARVLELGQPAGYHQLSP